MTTTKNSKTKKASAKKVDTSAQTSARKTAKSEAARGKNVQTRITINHQPLKINTSEKVLDTFSGDLTAQMRKHAGRDSTITDEPPERLTNTKIESPQTEKSKKPSEPISAN